MKGERKGEKNPTSRRWWRALQIGAALSTAFHAFLESFQRRIFFVRGGLSFLLFKAIFESARNLPRGFPGSPMSTPPLPPRERGLLAGAAVEVGAALPPPPRSRAPPPSALHPSPLASAPLSLAPATQGPLGVARRAPTTPRFLSLSIQAATECPSLTDFCKGTASFPC